MFVCLFDRLFALGFLVAVVLLVVVVFSVILSNQLCAYVYIIAIIS